MKNRLSKNILSGMALAAVLGTTVISTSVQAETLNMAWSQDATGLDPHKQTAFSSIRLLELIYEPLIRLNADLDIVPAVADSWGFAEDGMSLTFKLDPQAKFQNGEAVTSADVKASFERVLDEETGAASRANFLSISSIDTPNAQTVVFNLSRADTPMLTAMASLNAAIVPASQIAAGTIGTKAIGSGPFKLESWNPNSKEILSANKDWAGGSVDVDGINISVLPDESAILAALRAGQIDFALLNDPLIATLVPSVSGLNLNRTPSISYHVLQLNPAREPMTKLGVRQAISCAIDRQEILDTAALGEGKVTGPLTMPAYANDPSDLFCYNRDLDKARQLLADAGYPDGFSATVIAAAGEPATATAEAQVIQAQLGEIGIDLDIKIMELNVYIDAWLRADFDMAVALNGGRADPFTMYNRYWTLEGNLQKVSNFADVTLDALMQQGRIETNIERRKQIFAEFEKVIAKKSPWVWLYTSNGYTVTRDNVKGFVPSPTGSLFGLSDVTIK